MPLGAAVWDCLSPAGTAESGPCLTSATISIASGAPKNAARAAASEFPSENFRALKEKEIAKFGEYRTRRPVLEAWGKLA
jgi:hypothetical protein